jgi:hypothetical protein
MQQKKKKFFKKMKQHPARKQEKKEANLRSPNKIPKNAKCIMRSSKRREIVKPRT